MDVCTPDGLRKLRCILLTTAVDLPARALLLNMKQFNGKHGCCFCEAEGTTRNDDWLHRYWPPATATLRTHASIMQNAISATQERTTVSNAILIHIVWLGSGLSSVANWN